MKYIALFFSLFLCTGVFLPTSDARTTFDDVQYYEAEVQSVDTVEGVLSQTVQKITVLLSPGSVSEATRDIEVPITGQDVYDKGDRVIVEHRYEGATGQSTYFIADHDRKGSMYVLFGIFVLLTILVAKKRGLMSLISMVFSFVIIFTILLPSILGGWNPVLMAIISSVFIIPVSFYLTHGLSKKTTVAVLGTLIALVVAGLLSQVYIEVANLSGFVSEQVGFLQLYFGESINAKGLLLAGIIIGLLGILDDVTISQASIVNKLKEAAPHLSFKELYTKGMDVGKDHIGSVVNTLVLVYTGAALPLLLLFMTNTLPLDIALNSEMVAEEVIQMLIGSIGLVLAVPLTNFLACMMVNGEKDSEHEHNH